MPLASPELSSATREHPLPGRKPGWLRRLLGMRFLVISIAVHVVLGIVATIWVVQSYNANRKLTFKGGPPSPNRSTRAIEHKVQMAKKQSTTSAPANKRIVSTGLAKVTLPAMPAMPKSATAPSKMAGVGGANIGAAAAPMGAVGTSGGGGGLVSMFGLHDASGGGIQGTFYDLKQTQGKRPTEMNADKYVEVVKKFIKGGWNAGELSTYYKAPRQLYMARVMIPDIPAEEGPKAFQVEREVQPMLYLAWYKGEVVAPETGTFYFVGAGDDILFVRFNQHTVLNASWTIDEDALSKPTGHYDYGWTKQPRGFTKGEAVQVEAGKSYPIELLVGEQGGGSSHSILLIEKQGATYKKDSHGSPILPVFRMGNAKPPALERGQTLPPYEETSSIWQGSSAAKPTSALDALKH